jgi:hypothetical protein
VILLGCKIYVWGGDSHWTNFCPHKLD